MRWPIQSTFGWKLLVVVAIILKPFFLRLRIEGDEHIPLTGGCVIASNHTISPDYVVIGYASPRQVYYMAKAEIFYANRLVTTLLALAGAFPVNRGKGDSDAIAQAVRMVQRGFVVGMFPEGTRSRTGELQRGKTGVARIAMMSGAVIVPAAVIDAEPMLRDWLKFKRRPLVTMRFGPPVEPTGDPANPADVQRLTSRMMLAIAELLPPERRGYYGSLLQVAADDALVEDRPAG